MTVAPKQANCPEIRAEFDEEGRIYIDSEKRDDFDFDIVNFSYLSSNIQESPGYGVLFHS